MNQKHEGKMAYAGSEDSETSDPASYITNVSGDKKEKVTKKKTKTII